eukprot:Hpha_TRINITY_DN23759_c0_g1::TRINITY_DN23759_c0_g1_i1::g.93234::m.93234
MSHGFAAIGLGLLTGGTGNASVSTGLTFLIGGPLVTGVAATAEDFFRPSGRAPPSTDREDMENSTGFARGCYLLGQMCLLGGASCTVAAGARGLLLRSRAPAAAAKRIR